MTLQKVSYQMTPCHLTVARGGEGGNWAPWQRSCPLLPPVEFQFGYFLSFWAIFGRCQAILPNSCAPWKLLCAPLVPPTKSTLATPLPPCYSSCALNDPLLMPKYSTLYQLRDPYFSGVARVLLPRGSLATPPSRPSGYDTALLWRSSKYTPVTLITPRPPPAPPPAPGKPWKQIWNLGKSLRFPLKFLVHCVTK